MAHPAALVCLTRQAGGERLDFEGQQLRGVVAARQQLAPRPRKQAGLLAVHLGVVLRKVGGRVGGQGKEREGGWVVVQKLRADGLSQAAMHACTHPLQVTNQSPRLQYDPPPAPAPR